MDAHKNIRIVDLGPGGSGYRRTPNGPFTPVPSFSSAEWRALEDAAVAALAKAPASLELVGDGGDVGHCAAGCVRRRVATVVDCGLGGGNAGGDVDGEWDDAEVAAGSVVACCRRTGCRWPSGWLVGGLPAWLSVWLSAWLARLS